MYRNKLSQLFQQIWKQNKTEEKEQFYTRVDIFFIRYCIQHIFNTDAIFSIWLSQVTYESTNKESKIYTDFLITKVKAWQQKKPYVIA